MKYPKGYEWLANVGTLPLVLQKAFAEYGTIETPGARNNPTIMNWAKEIKQTAIYTADAVPWCGLFVAVITHRSGKGFVKSPLWALNWAKFGSSVGQPCLGDILVFQRDGGGHVGFYIGEDKETYHVLGGNQSDSVCITRIYKKRCVAVRRPRMLIGKPSSVKPYIIASTGALISTNEA